MEGLQNRHTINCRGLDKVLYALQTSE